MSIRSALRTLLISHVLCEFVEFPCTRLPLTLTSVTRLRRLANCNRNGRDCFRLRHSSWQFTMAQNPVGKHRTVGSREAVKVFDSGALAGQVTFLLSQVVRGFHNT